MHKEDTFRGQELIGPEPLYNSTLNFNLAQPQEGQHLYQGTADQMRQLGYVPSALGPGQMPQQFYDPEYNGAGSFFQQPIPMPHEAVSYRYQQEMPPFYAGTRGFNTSSSFVSGSVNYGHSQIQYASPFPQAPLPQQVQPYTVSQYSHQPSSFSMSMQQESFGQQGYYPSQISLQQYSRMEPPQIHQYQMELPQIPQPQQIYYPQMHQHQPLGYSTPISYHNEYYRQIPQNQPNVPHFQDERHQFQTRFPLQFLPELHFAHRPQLLHDPQYSHYFRNRFYRQPNDGNNSGLRWERAFGKY